MDEVLPAPRLFILGLQHLFIMYAGAVAVPLIVGGALGLPISTIGLLVNADLFVSGIATVIQRRRNRGTHQVRSGHIFLVFRVGSGPNGSGWLKTVQLGVDRPA